MKIRRNLVHVRRSGHVQSCMTGSCNSASLLSGSCNVAARWPARSAKRGHVWSHRLTPSRHLLRGGQDVREPLPSDGGGQQGRFVRTTRYDSLRQRSPDTPIPGVQRAAYGPSRACRTSCLPRLAREGRASPAARRSADVHRERGRQSSSLLSSSGSGSGADTVSFSNTSYPFTSSLPPMITRPSSRWTFIGTRPPPGPPAQRVFVPAGVGGLQSCRDSAQKISTKNRVSPTATVQPSNGPAHNARRLPTVRTTDARPLLSLFVEPLDLGIGGRDHVSVVGVASDPVG